MTAVERVDRALKDTTWEEAEEAGIEILARCISLHYNVRNEGREYIESLFERLGKRVIEWTKEHSMELATAHVFLKMEKECLKKEEK